MPAGREESATLRGLVQAARRQPRHVVLPEGDDPRIVAGAARAAREGIARVTLLGDPARIEAQLRELGGAGSAIQIEDPGRSPRLAGYAQAYFELRKARGCDSVQAATAIKARPIAAAGSSFVSFIRQPGEGGV